jgi:signal transduction histidine kinase
MVPWRKTIRAEHYLSGKLTRHKRSFSPIYLAILAGILLVILTINGFLEINRTENGFYRLLEREGTVLVQHFEKNIQETLVSLQTLESSSDSPFVTSLASPFYGIEESIAEYLLDSAHRIDQMDGERPMNPADFRAFSEQYLVTCIELYDSGGRLLRGLPLPPSSTQRGMMLRELIQNGRPVFIDLFDKPARGKEGDSWFSIAVWRKSGPGIVALHLNKDQMKKLFRQFAVQRAISDIGLREGILYVSVQDATFKTMAHSDPSLLGVKEEDPFLKDSLQTPLSRSRIYQLKKGEEVFEVSKAFSLDNIPSGLIRVGFSPKEIEPVLRQIKENVLLSLLFFLILGVSAISLIWVNQNRHLVKLKEMEDRVQRAERLSSLGHLAAGVAHEIRNPLNAIGIGLQRLKREFLPQDEAKKEEYVAFSELIFNEIRRVNGIIEQFLTLSRPFQLDPKPSSLQELIKNIVTLFQGEAASRGITLYAEIAPEPPLIDMDGERLTQAIINIMKNGIQAMDQGGTLRIQTRSLKNRVEVIIADSGAGIPADQMEKIFNYYYTTKKDGVGLGLPIAHRIIEAHGGQLKVESRAGRGTTMTISLPVQQQEKMG